MKKNKTILNKVTLKEFCERFVKPNTLINLYEQQIKFIDARNNITEFKTVLLGNLMDGEIISNKANKRPTKNMLQLSPEYYRDCNVIAVINEPNTKRIHENQIDLIIDTYIKADIPKYSPTQTKKEEDKVSWDIVEPSSTGIPVDSWCSTPSRDSSLQSDFYRIEYHKESLFTLLYHRYKQTFFDTIVASADAFKNYLSELSYVVREEQIDDPDYEEGKLLGTLYIDNNKIRIIEKISNEPIGRQYQDKSTIELLDTRGVKPYIVGQVKITASIPIINPNSDYFNVNAYCFRDEDRN